MKNKIRIICCIFEYTATPASLLPGNTDAKPPAVGREGATKFENNDPLVEATLSGLSTGVNRDAVEAKFCSRFAKRANFEKDS